MEELRLADLIEGKFYWCELPNYDVTIVEQGDGLTWYPGVDAPLQHWPEPIDGIRFWGPIDKPRFEEER